jgi:hypothetical protein
MAPISNFHEQAGLSRTMFCPAASLPGIASPKDGVASLAYAPAIHLIAVKMDARVKPAHDN